MEIEQRVSGMADDPLLSGEQAPQRSVREEPLAANLTPSFQQECGGDFVVDFLFVLLEVGWIDPRSLLVLV